MTRLLIPSRPRRGEQTSSGDSCTAPHGGRAAHLPLPPPKRTEAGAYPPIALGAATGLAQYQHTAPTPCPACRDALRLLIIMQMEPTSSSNWDPPVVRRPRPSSLKTSPLRHGWAPLADSAVVRLCKKQAVRLPNTAAVQGRSLAAGRWGAVPAVRATVRRRSAPGGWAGWYAWPSNAGTAAPRRGEPDRRGRRRRNANWLIPAPQAVQ